MPTIKVIIFSPRQSTTIQSNRKQRKLRLQKLCVDWGTARKGELSGWTNIYLKDIKSVRAVKGVATTKRGHKHKQVSCFSLLSRYTGEFCLEPAVGERLAVLSHCHTLQSRVEEGVNEILISPRFRAWAVKPGSNLSKERSCGYEIRFWTGSHCTFNFWIRSTGIMPVLLTCLYV